MKKIILVFLCSWLISCGSDKGISIPENVLSKEKMAQVMTDMHLLEASMNLNISNAITTDKTPDMESKVQGVLKKNAVTKEQYETSFAFYASHADLLSELYTEVMNDLSQLQAKVANEKTPDPKDMIPVKDKEQAQKDSIKKVEDNHSKKDSIKRNTVGPGHLKSQPDKKQK